MARQRRNAWRPNGKFYIFIGAIAAAVVVVFLLVSNINTAVVEQGEIRFEAAVPVVVVRDEQVISAENYGKANYLVEEGSRVEADSGVAEVYKWGYTDKVMNELMDKQTSIEQYQENLLAETGDAQLAAINDSISQKSEEIRQIIDTGVGDVQTAERELKQLMQGKQDYLKEAVQSDGQLEAFYSEEKQLLERVDGWRAVVAAPQTGVVSFYMDGAEDTLNARNLQKLTLKDITDIIDGSTLEHKTAEDSAEQPLFRLVNNFKWYLVIDMQSPMIEFANGNEFDVAFADYVAKQYHGTVVGHVIEEDGVLYVIEINEDIGELLSTRRTDATVYTRFDGMKVPEAAVKEQDGVTGVTVVAGKDKTFVPVTVKIIKDGSAIVEPVDAGSVLAVNAHVEV